MKEKVILCKAIPLVAEVVMSLVQVVLFKTVQMGIKNVVIVVVVVVQKCIHLVILFNIQK